MKKRKLVDKKVCYASEIKRVNTIIYFMLSVMYQCITTLDAFKVEKGNAVLEKLTLLDNSKGS